jgi:hypothetical protein
MLLLVLTGILGASWKRDTRTAYFLVLIISVYIFFTSLSSLRLPRFTICWLPAFCVFAALPFIYLWKNKKFYLSGIIVLLVFVGYQITQVYAKSPYYATGYSKAARYILNNKTSHTVFFDGYCDGFFTYFMRVFDPAKSMYVLRGDKLLSSSSIYPGHRLTVHAFTDDDIKEIFDKYGIVHIVVESKHHDGVEIHQKLRTFLQTGPFRLVHEIPIETNRERLEGQSLKIYKYLEAKPMTAKLLELHLPVVGKILRVEMPRSLQE